MSFLHRWLVQRVDGVDDDDGNNNHSFLFVSAFDSMMVGECQCMVEECSAAELYYCWFVVQNQIARILFNFRSYVIDGLFTHFFYFALQLITCSVRSFFCYVTVALPLAFN